MDVARAAIQTAGGWPNPTLNVTPGLNFSHVNAAPGLSPWFPFVSFDVPLETAGKRGYRIAQAQQLSESARLNIAATAWEVRANVRANLLDYSAAGSARRSCKMRFPSSSESSCLWINKSGRGRWRARRRCPFASPRKRPGLTWRTPSAKALIARAPGGIHWRSGPRAGWRGGVHSFPDAAAAASLTTDEIRREALLSRADVLAALADYAAAQSALQLEIARQYPDVHLSPGYQFDQGDNMWTLGLTVELPVLNQNQGPIAEAAARRTEASARFNALQAKVLADIDAAVESFRATEKSLALLQDLAAAQAKSRDAIAAQVNAGAAAQLDLLNAQLEFAEAEEGSWKRGSNGNSPWRRWKTPCNVPLK